MSFLSSPNKTFRLSVSLNGSTRIVEKEVNNMERWRYCPECEQEVQFAVATHREEHSIRGEKIEMDFPALQCSVCGIELFDEELSGAALRSAYDEVRRRKGMPNPEELKSIRTRMGLSQREFAKLLGWSHITIHRYEKGSLPNEAHATVLNELRVNPGYALSLFQKNQRNFSDDEADKVKSKLIGFFREGLGSDWEQGNRSFDIDRLGGMVCFFALKTQLVKTKLLKLLWYADFLHFKRYEQSISGMKYVRLPFGPVPDNYNNLLSSLENEGIISIEPVVLGPYDAEIIIPKENSKLDCLKEEEGDTLDAVWKQFAYWTARDISSYSHREVAYTATAQRDVIEYKYAKDLSLA